MKVISKIAAYTVFVFCLIFALAPAAKASDYFIANDDVNFRDGSSTDSKVIKAIWNGTSIDVVDHDPAGWSKVKIDGNAGYIKSEFLTYPVGSNGAAFMTTDGVNFRKTASTDGEIIETLYPNITVTVVDHKPATWSKVSHNGKTGYIRSDFLTRNVAASSGNSSGTAASGSTASASASSGNAASATATVSTTSSAAPVQSQQAAKTYYTNDGVNFRTGASIESKIICGLVSGTAVKMLDYGSSGWSKVEYDSTTGYIKTEFLSLTDGKLEMLQWSEVKSFLKTGTIIPVIDVRTGVKYNIRCFSLSGHADVEPVTKADTDTIYQLRGGNWSWAARPVWVKINGRLLAASINGMPHDVSTISDNGMSGHLCLHFGGTVTNNKSYQEDLRRGVQEAWDAR